MKFLEIVSLDSSRIKLPEIDTSSGVVLIVLKYFYISLNCF